MSADKYYLIDNNLPEMLVTLERLVDSKVFVNFNPSVRKFLKEISQDVKCFTLTIINCMNYLNKSRDNGVAYHLLYNLARCSQNVVNSCCEKIREFLFSENLLYEIKLLLKSLILVLESFEQKPILYGTNSRRKLNDRRAYLHCKATLYKFIKENELTFHPYQQSKDLLQAKHSLTGHCSGHVFSWLNANVRGVSYRPSYNSEVSLHQHRQESSLEELEKLHFQKGVPIEINQHWAERVANTIDEQPHMQFIINLRPMFTKPGGHAVGIRRLANLRYEFFDSNLGQVVCQDKRQMIAFLDVYRHYAISSRYYFSFVYHSMLNPVTKLPKAIQQQIAPLLKPGQTLAHSVKTIIDRLEPTSQIRKQWLATIIHDEITLGRYIEIKCCDERYLLNEFISALNQEAEGCDSSSVDFIMAEVSFRFNSVSTAMKRRGNMPSLNKFNFPINDYLKLRTMSKKQLLLKLRQELTDISKITDTAKLAITVLKRRDGVENKQLISWVSQYKSIEVDIKGYLQDRAQTVGAPDEQDIYFSSCSSTCSVSSSSGLRVGH